MMHHSRPKFNPQFIWSGISDAFKMATANTGPKNSKISTADCLMSAAALFSMKYPSMLQFENAKSEDATLRHNLKTLYCVENTPCDTYMRERLDVLNEDIVRNGIKFCISILKREKKLNDWHFMEKKILLSIDGVEFFNSKEVHCSHCCEKTHTRKNGTEYKSYNHQAVVAAIVHPDMKTVIPLDFEPICKKDGDTKNDCERNASKRLLERIKKEHSTLDFIILADGLSSNAPFINTIKNFDYNYILVAKETDHKYLSDYFWAGTEPDIIDYSIPLKEGKKEGEKQYRSMSNVPLNATHHNLLVNVLYTKEVLKYKDKKQKEKENVYKCMWVTDLELNRKTIPLIEKGGRTRWHIENQTFNTLKNQGYNFEHNYGHGNDNLSNVLAGLMILAFLVDQILQSFNKEFQACLKKCGSRIFLWEKIRGAFGYFFVKCWDDLYAGILDPPVFTFPAAS